jgi:DNA processing protein
VRAGRTPLEALPDPAWVLALAALPEMGPRRMEVLLAGRPGRVAFEQVRAGDAGRRLVGAGVSGGVELARRWSDEAARLDVAELWARHLGAGCAVVTRRSSGYPAAFVDDPHPPAIVVSQGDLGVLDGPRVAVVGTRDCTGYGRDVAYELGHDLAAAGVRVVSGLALGIDGAAHAGALAAGRDGEPGVGPPVGVVATGLDVVYPRRHRDLWRRVAAHGVLLSEHPLGRGVLPWQFLARNRLIAALADVVVVVESHAKGGALGTADEAEARQRTLMAVPGSVRSPASGGTNGLLAERDAKPCRHAGDVLALLRIDPAVPPQPVDDRPAPSGDDLALLDAMGWEPAGTDQLLVRTGRTLEDLAAGLDRLEGAGWVAARGGWYERVAAARR